MQDTPAQFTLNIPGHSSSDPDPKSPKTTPAGWQSAADTAARKAAAVSCQLQ